MSSSPSSGIGETITTNLSFVIEDVEKNPLSFHFILFIVCFVLCVVFSSHSRVSDGLWEIFILFIWILFVVFVKRFENHELIKRDPALISPSHHCCSSLREEYSFDDFS